MPANAFLTNAAVGNREDLIDVIYRTTPTDTPWMSMIDKVDATAVTHEWQRDVLAAPANNAVAEGADATYTAVTPTERLSNQTQISRKTFSISDTQEKVKKAGRKSEIRLQTLKKGLELKKDMEIAIIENGTLTTGATRVTRGLRGWIQEAANNSLGVGGVAPVSVGGNTAPTDGTLRTFTEAILRTAHLGVYNAGGEGTSLLVHPTMKQWVSSTFTGGGTKYIKAEAQKIEAAWDIYVGDFGNIEVVPDRVMSRTREAYIVSPNMAALAVLREMTTEELARIGSARNYMMEVEYAFECREPRAHFAIRDIQAS